MSSRNRNAIRVATVGVVVALSGSIGQAPALAERPPQPSGALPSGSIIAPHSKQESQCLPTQKVPDGPEVPAAQRYLDFRSAWPFATGRGQTVAVIDTGVSHHPRLPGLVGGGDYVSDKDGTEDCDAHGTVVAGLIAATAVPGQGFSGVAPDARIVSIRQSSGVYRDDKGGNDNEDEKTAKGYGDITTLASAVRRAADTAGVTIINISETACAGAPFNDGPLGAAVKYAAEEKNIVIVSSAGNAGEECKPGTNPGLDPLHPKGDKWANLSTYVTPSWYSDYVLSVGSVDASGAPSKFTVPGPWVGVAAPGENLTSLDARGSGLANAKGSMDNKTEPFTGTSFSSPLVAGTVALVRQRFPQLNAREVIRRIESTAHAPAQGWNPYIGYGIVDPVAAVTAEMPPNSMPSSDPKSKQMAIPKAPAPPDHRSRNAALIGSAIIGVLLALGLLISFPLRRRFKLDDDAPGK